MSAATFTLDNGWRIDFPTKPAGVLRLGPGPVRIDARFSRRFRAEDGWYTVLDCRLRLADAEGRLWQATSTFVSDCLLYPLIDLARKEPGRWLRKAPPTWREALEERALLRDVASTYDDRFYRYVWLDNTFFVLQFKYLGAAFTLAPLTADRLVVSAAHLFCSWNPWPVHGPDTAPRGGHGQSPAEDRPAHATDRPEGPGREVHP